MDFIHHFGIDWKLLLAQIINFFILLFLLRRFAFGPIMRMLKSRRDQIEKGILLSQESEEKMKVIQKERDVVLAKAQKDALSVIEKAEQKAGIETKDIIQGANARAANIIEDAKKKAEEEGRKMEDKVYAHAHDLVRMGIERVLGKMPEKESDTLVEEALKELRNVK